MKVTISRLRFTQAITTVSHWMKHVMWGWGCNPIVLHNGIPGRWLDHDGEMMRLADDHADLRSCIRIVDAPGMAITLACDLPGVVISHAAPAERL